MQLQDMWAALRRRWYLVVIAILLSGVSAFLAVRAVGPTYEAESAVLLLPPGATGEGTKGNPLVELSGLTQARDVVIRAVTSKATYDELCRTAGDAGFEEMQSELCKPSPSVSYEATPDFTSSAPMILFTAEATSPTTAVTALATISGRVELELESLQKGLNLRPREEITSVPVVLDGSAKVIRKAQIRAGLAVASGSLVLGLLCIGLVDGLVLGRRQRKSESTEPAKPVEKVDEIDSSDDEDATYPGRSESRGATGRADEGEEEKIVADSEAAETDQQVADQTDLVGRR